MAKVLKKDAHVAQKEEKIQSVEETLSKEREMYLELLKKDERFQRFVIGDLLDKLIAQLTDIRNFDLEGSPDEVKRMLGASKAARATLEKFRSHLVP